MRIVDIFTLLIGRISAIAMVADELAAFAAVQAAGVINRPLAL